MSSIVVKGLRIGCPRPRVRQGTVLDGSNHNISRSVSVPEANLFRGISGMVIKETLLSPSLEIDNYSGSVEEKEIRE